jgi:hypothetical protein
VGEILATLFGWLADQAHAMGSLRRYCPDQVLGVADLRQPLSLSAPSSISQTHSPLDASSEHISRAEGPSDSEKSG